MDGAERDIPTVHSSILPPDLRRRARKQIFESIPT